MSGLLDTTNVIYVDVQLKKRTVRYILFCHYFKVSSDEKDVFLLYRYIRL